jgi:hypothetical protein
MEPIQTQEQLLVHLAGNGDPCAFYTLMVPFANDAYVAERNSGKRHSETLAALLPSFKKMYQNYISSPVQGAFKEWYKEQEKKYLSASQEVAIESLNEAGFKDLLMADIVHFDWALNLILQRHYGKFRRARNRGAVGGPNSFFQRDRWFFKTALYAGLLGVFIILSYLYLTFSKSHFTVSLSSAQATHTLVMPIRMHNPLQGTPVSHSNAIAAENAFSATTSPQSLLLHDTILIHDTVRIIKRPKPPETGLSSLSSGALPLVQKSPQPLPAASSPSKVADVGKPGISPAINKTIP